MLARRWSPCIGPDADAIRVEPLEAAAHLLRCLTFAPHPPDARPRPVDLHQIANSSWHRLLHGVDGGAGRADPTAPRTYLRPYRRLLIGVLLLTSVGTMAALYLPSLNASIIDDGVAKGDTAFIWRPAA